MKYSHFVAVLLAGAAPDWSQASQINFVVPERNALLTLTAHNRPSPLFVICVRP